MECNHVHREEAAEEEHHDHRGDLHAGFRNPGESEHGWGEEPHPNEGGAQARLFEVKEWSPERVSGTISCRVKLGETKTRTSGVHLPPPDSLALRRT